MRRVIQQSEVLPAPAERLFEMYLHPAEHEAITGAPVQIGELPGSPFKAFDGMLSGTILSILRPKLIIQSWRSAHFRESDPDSTLILMFSPEADQGRIDLVHLDVPEHDFQGVTEGWPEHYWIPWRRLLERR
jgi:activator of HSP90 ATPase